jgi:hypothetical protein
VTGRRGHVWAALVAVTVLMMTSTACQRSQRVDIPPDPNTPTLTKISLKFADVSGDIAPESIDGAPTTVSPDFIWDDPGAKFRVKDGKLTVEPTQARQGASYYSVDLGAPVVTIGARWTYNPRGGTRDGSMVLLVSNTVVKPPFPVHLSVSAYKWAYGVWPPLDGDKIPTLDNIQEGQFDPPLKEDGTTVYEAEVALDGDRALISLPDGQRITVRDKRIAEWAGNYATFEAWAKNGVTDAAVGFTEIWAVRRNLG